VLTLLGGEPPAWLLSRSSEERVAEYGEGAGVGLAAGVAEGVVRRPDLHLVEAGLFEHRLPARPGQPACDSTGPEVDVARRGVGYGVAIRDVGELQHAAGAQHTVDLGEDGRLVRAQIDYPVGDHDVGPCVVDG
jgi:hypothetical protein